MLQVGVFQKPAADPGSVFLFSTTAFFLVVVGVEATPTMQPVV
jgi:hypothetical protein